MLSDVGQARNRRHRNGGAMKPTSDPALTTSGTIHLASSSELIECWDGLTIIKLPHQPPWEKVGTY